MVACLTVLIAVLLGIKSNHIVIGFGTRMIIELIIMVLWGTTLVTMTLPKGKDFKHLFDEPPYWKWSIAVVLAILGMLVS